MKCISGIRFAGGFTLPEMALTIGLAVILSVSGVFSGMYVQNVQREAQIHAALETVVAAQRFYLIDHPVESYASLAISALAPYFPGGVQPPLPEGSMLSTTNYPPVVSWNGKLYQAKEY